LDHLAALIDAAGGSISTVRIYNSDSGLTGRCESVGTTVQLATRAIAIDKTSDVSTNLFIVPTLLTAKYIYLQKWSP